MRMRITSIVDRNTYNKIIPFIMNKLTVKKRSKDEIYQSIINKLNKRYKGKLSDKEIDDAAKNLINFCKVIVESKNL